jgi:transcription initiation factor TFIIIB Brf1 subunit/transcription initiation factor TFIIB
MLQGTIYICKTCKIRIPLDRTDTCPHERTMHDPKRAEWWCADCGLVLYHPYDYSAGHKINYPWRCYDEDGNGRKTSSGEMEEKI